MDIAFLNPIFQKPLGCRIVTLQAKITSSIDIEQMWFQRWIRGSTRFLAKLSDF